jgi:hypothetical protein
MPTSTERPHSTYLKHRRDIAFTILVEARFKENILLLFKMRPGVFKDFREHGLKISLTLLLLSQQGL